jgi:mono/diheme cytochrome c family protein
MTRQATLVAVVASLMLAGCDSLPGRPKVAQGESPGGVAAFDRLYARNCAGCHGADGRLGAARPLHDPVYLALVGADRLRAIVGSGVTGTSMPAFESSGGGPLTAAHIDALTTGMIARWGRPDALKGVSVPPYQPDGADAGSAERGAIVYASACARCHGPTGTGGTTAGSIVDASYLALVSDQSLRTTVIAGRPDLSKPDWREDVPGQPLTPQQISDVVAWLASHRRPVPGRPAASPPTGARAIPSAGGSSMNHAMRRDAPARGVTVSRGGD